MRCLIILLAITFQACVCVASLKSVLQPKDYADINGKQYFFSPIDVKRNAKDATVYCNDIGMNLASLETTEEMLAVIDYLKTNGWDSNWWWTSGKEYYNSWVWTNMGELFFGEDEKWISGQPFTGNCHCVSTRPMFGGLSSQDCNTGNNIICEEKPVVP